MDTNEFIGTIIAVGLPLLVSIIAIIKPIINLNTSIVKLNVTIEQLIDDNTGIKGELKEHDDTLKDHEKRLYLMEHRKYDR